MVISTQQARHIAQLARLEIKEDKLELFARQFGDILAYVDVLNNLDTSGVEPTAHVMLYGNVMREDVIKPSLTQREILSNAPETKDGGYLVPRVMEGGGA